MKILRLNVIKKLIIIKNINIFMSKDWDLALGIIIY